MSKSRLLAVGACLLVLTVASTASADDWEHIDTTDGVWVYEKEAGDDVMFRGVTEADVSIGELFAVYRNPEHRPYWVDNYENHETFERDESSEIYWMHLDMPFGVSDRDYVLEANYEFNEGNWTIEAVTESIEDDRKPEDDCCTRAETRTEYTFQAQPGEETTTIEVVVEVDLKGRVPSRVVDSATEEWPVETLNGLIDRTKQADVEPDSRVDDWHDR